MVATQLAARDVSDQRVLAAMRRVPRHAFVPPELARHAYEDGPLPIGHGQTISQPYVVARMVQAALPRPGGRVLEVGAGCGYQTAVLAELAAEVVALEIVPELAEDCAQRLAALGCPARVLCADGGAGHAAGAPWDAVVVAAAPPSVPAALVDQLAPGGRLVLPVGEADQRLIAVRREGEGVRVQELFPVRFVPLTGAAFRADGGPLS